MTTFVVGDLHGCLTPLKKLLDEINFAQGSDKLWFVGDLVNRGPESLETLRFVKSLGTDAICVLGNHDLHLLGVAHGIREPNGKDTLPDILNSDDRDELIDWVRHLPLIHRDEQLKTTMVHAGIHPKWNLAQALVLANEVENVLRSNNYVERLPKLFGNKPTKWSKKLGKRRRQRLVLNTFTRMRYCTKKAEVDFSQTCPPAKAPKSLVPWYAAPKRIPIEDTLVFGHWSSHPANAIDGVIPLDRGCVWGGSLAALALETGEVTTVEGIISSK